MILVIGCNLHNWQDRGGGDQEGAGAGPQHHAARRRVQARPGGRLPRDPLRAAPGGAQEVGRDIAALSAVRGADFKLVYHQIKDRWEFSDRIVSNPQALKIVLC